MTPGAKTIKPSKSNLRKCKSMGKENMSTITFLGLGAMGSRMAAHLIDAGHQVTVWNRTAAATEPLVAKGATAAATPAAAAQNAEVVISMVRDNDASRYVWLDSQDGALTTLPKQAIAIESSTLTPEWVQTLATECERAGVQFADAPVAGSRPQAEAAKLIYFVGAEQDTFEKIQPLLSIMGGAVHHSGPIGSGATIKLAVNALFGVQLSTVAELLGLLKSAGLDLQQSYDIIADTPVCSPAAKLAGNAMIAGQFAPAFPIELVEKDFGYIELAAKQAQVDVPLSAATRHVLQRAIEEGFGKDNITGIAQRYLGGAR